MLAILLVGITMQALLLIMLGKIKMSENKRSAGGIARANALSKSEKSEIAKKAAEARWANASEIMVANHGGTLRFGEINIDCYVTENGCRVVSASGLRDALMLVDKDSSQKSGSRILRLFDNKTLNPLFVELDSINLFIPIKCKYKGRRINGYDANIIVNICSVMYKAGLLGLITTARLKIIAEQCGVIFSAFAKLGITALIDEATGYQEVRDKDALQKILDKYLDDYAHKWSKTFPDEFWSKLLRAKGYESYIGLPRPQFVGHWVNDVVYARLAPGILEELKKRNPRKATGNRQFKHTQFLSEGDGVPELKEHLIKAMTIMDMAIVTEATGENFDVLLNKVLPKYNTTLEIPYTL
jgi:hypothetical protein